MRFKEYMQDVQMMTIGVDFVDFRDIPRMYIEKIYDIKLFKRDPKANACSVTGSRWALEKFLRSEHVQMDPAEIWDAYPEL